MPLSTKKKINFHSTCNKNNSKDKIKGVEVKFPKATRKCMEEGAKKEKYHYEKINVVSYNLKMSIKTY